MFVFLIIKIIYDRSVGLILFGWIMIYTFDFKSHDVCFENFSPLIYLIEQKKFIIWWLSNFQETIRVHPHTLLTNSSNQDTGLSCRGPQSLFGFAPFLGVFVWRRSRYTVTKAGASLSWVDGCNCTQWFCTRWNCIVKNKAELNR